MSLFIIIFQKGKYINEKKDRVKVMHIENFTKPLYWVFPTDSLNWFFNCFLFFLFITAFEYGLKYIQTGHEDDTMDGLRAAIQRCNLSLKLDNETEGHGNCFPIAIMQQIKRPEILNQMRAKPKRLVTNKKVHSMLRCDVRQFIMKSRSPRITEFKAQYEET